MDNQALINLRPKIYNTTATYAQTRQMAELQWRIGNNQRFEIYYTDSNGWTAMHVIGHYAVMHTADADWLIKELASDGIEMSAGDAERIVQQYALATTAAWHPYLPRYVQSFDMAAYA